MLVYPTVLAKSKRMETYSVGDLADLIAGADAERTGEDLFKPKKKKCKTIEDNEEIIPSPKKKKKRKSVGEDSAIEDVDTAQNENAATPAGQKRKHEEDEDPPEETSAPEAERMSPKKKKKKKKKKDALEETVIEESLDTTPNAASFTGQESKLEADEEGPAKEGESVVPKKKKKKISKEEDALDENGDLTLDSDGLAAREEKDEVKCSVGTGATEEKSVLSKKKKKKKKDAEECSGTAEGNENMVIEDMNIKIENGNAVIENGNLATDGDGVKEEPAGSADATKAESVLSRKKKKKKQKAAEECSGTAEGNENMVTEDVNIKIENGNAVIENGNLATDDDGVKEEPTGSADATEAESVLPKKKKKKKKKKAAEECIGAAEGNENVVTEDVNVKIENGNMTENGNTILENKNLATYGDGVKEEPTGSADDTEAERSLKKKETKSKKSSNVTKGVEKQVVDEKSKINTHRNSGKETGGEITSQEVVPKEVASTGLKPSKKKMKSTLQKKTGQDLPGEAGQKEKVLKKLEKENQSNIAQNDKDTSKKPMQKENIKLKNSEKKLLKEKRIAESLKNSLPTKHHDAEERTVFVGNVNINTKRRMLAKLFRVYGNVETVRIRNIAVANLNMSKKEAVAKGMLHPKRTSLNAYVRFVDKESVEKALEANGTELLGHHLIVNRSLRKASEKPKHSVFIGNLPWEAEEEGLYKHFSECGEIESVRIIRDRKLGSGKGFGYVNFKSHDAVEVALQLSGKDFGGRALRIKRAVKKVKVCEEFGTKQKERVLPGHQPKMKLNFMKKSKGKQLEKDEFARKQSKIDFSGVKTSKAETFEKGKRMKLNKDEKKKAYIAQKLAGGGSSARFGGPKSKSFQKSESSKPLSSGKSSQKTED